MSLVFAALASELTLRWLDLPADVTSGWRSHGAAKDQRNDFDLRGRPIRYADSDLVVLLLGDSQVEALACAFERMPERRLEAHLRGRGHSARVFSLGTGGWGQDQQLLALRDYYDRHRADVVALWVTPMNDVWNNLFLQHNKGVPKPTFWLADGRLRGPVQPPGAGTRSSIRLIRAFQFFVPPDPDRAWARGLPAAYEPLPRWEGTIDPAHERRVARALAAGKEFAIGRHELGMGLVPPSPRILHAIDLTRALITEIEGEVRGHDGRLVVFDRQLPGPEEAVYPVAGGYYVTSERQYRENVRALFAGFDAHLIPLDTRPATAPGDSHLNEAAVDELMERFAEVVSPRLEGDRDEN